MVDSTFNSDLYMYSICDSTFLADGSPEHIEFLGTGFAVNGRTIVTCKHVIEAKRDESSLFAITKNGGSFPIQNVKSHPTYDFSGCQIQVDQAVPFLSIVNAQLTGGVDLYGYGKVIEHVGGGNRRVKGYMFKGNVVRAESEHEIPGSRSTCELSFPVLKGMSGGPLLVYGREEPTVCGMLYGNKETALLSHALESREEDGTRYLERVERIYELGCCHTAMDIREFMSDLSIEYQTDTDGT